MALLEKTGRAIAFTLGLAMACTAHAQSPSSQPKSYPNTENFGGDADRNAPWFQECLRVAHVQPSGAAPALPPSCKAYNYYDKRSQAVTSNTEWAGVLACAQASGDNAVLSMLYANGLGVPRNLDLATRFACSAGGAQAEVVGRIGHLQALQSSAPGTNYDQCDDITSGYMGGICASIADAQADKVRTGYFARLRRQLPAQQVAPFDQLVTATNTFAHARGEETDLSGTARGAQVIDAEASEKEWLREHLAAFEKGNLNLTPAHTLADADDKLNRAYQALMAMPASDKEHPDRLPGSTVNKADVRAAQRLWLAYRDAWARFATLRYPALALDDLKTMLTEWRTKQLGGMGVTRV